MNRDAPSRWQRPDLTRWNRGGLARLLYADGNAADFLETIRSQLAGDFEGRWQDRLSPPFDRQSLTDAELDEEAWLRLLEEEDWIRVEASRRLRDQYLDVSGDMGWELARVFARSSHVLAHHVDAHANGAFLRTASEWEDLRRMVAVLGYRPAGATSATTMLAIEARGSGRVEKGLQVRHRPTDGGKAIIFETLEGVDVDETFNAFTPAGARVSKTPLVDAEAAGQSGDRAPPWKENPKAPIAGTDGTLILKDRDGSDAEAAWVLERRDRKLRLGHEGDKWENWELGRVNLLSSPRFRRKPWINGSTVRRSAIPHGLAAGSIVAWRMAKEEDPLKWRFAEVKRADAFGIELVNIIRDFDRKNDDERWPDYGPVDIELRKATRLTGSYTVPSADDPEAEKTIGYLKNFLLSDMVDGSVLEKPEPPEPEKIFGFKNNGRLFRNGTNAPDLEQFILWLFKVAGFATSFPPSPLDLVKVGAMLMVKDARIPSTGQLVFEAFLDLFGGGAEDNIDVNDPQEVVPALFRYWGDPDTDPDPETPSLPDQPPGRLPFSKVAGEMWYLPKIRRGGGDAPIEVVEPESYILRNGHDDSWFFFDGLLSGLRPGAWAAGKFAGDARKWRAVRIEDVVSPLISSDRSVEPFKRYDQRSGFAVKLNLPDTSEFSSPAKIPELLELQADFRASDAAVGATDNEAIPVNPIELHPCPNEDLVGRTLLAANSEGRVQIVRVTAVENCQVTLSPPLAQGFAEGDLTLFGNTVRAGHGERRPPVRMGAGVDADRPSVLTLEHRNVSTVPDPRLSRGAREDLEVRIEGARWSHVAWLDDSEATDRHYAVATTEDGFLHLTFGDGQAGRALPPGTQNVEIAFRTGAGSRGTVPAGSLEQLVDPHPLVKAVRQPEDASGGADMESRDDMRSRAPASLLALERAVSLADFEQLAMQHRSVAQARAYFAAGDSGHSDTVTVVAVPSSGDALSDSVKKDVAQFLQSRAIPTVRVEVEGHNAVPVRLSIEIRVDYVVYDPDETAAAVKEALADRFSIHQRSIGRPLPLSAVYAAVESVAGVEDSICRFMDPPGSDQAVIVTSRQLAAIADRNAVECTHSEYVP